MNIIEKAVNICLITLMGIFTIAIGVIFGTALMKLF
jgi:hypothetical protein